MKLTGVMIGSDNPASLGEFYAKVFGKPGWEEKDWYGFQIETGTLMIGPHSDVHGKNKEPARLMITFETTDVKGEFEKFKAIADATVIAEPYQPNAKESPNIWLATIADPDGNYLQLASPWE